MAKRYGFFIRGAISGLLAFIICLLFVEKEYRYAASIVSSRPFNFENQYFYYDLDHDGKSERIIFFSPVDNLTSLILYEWDGDLVEQFNLEGNIIERSGIYTGDYDLDGLDELYIFTHLEDSLFLNVINPFLNRNQLLARRKIGVCHMLNGKATYAIDGSVMEDINGDGREEFYFSINAGFTLSPRRVYCYDLINDSLHVSPVSGSSPRYNFRGEDIDGDGFVELFGESTAYANYGDSLVPFNDMSAWLMVFSHQLDFEFEPMEFPGFGSAVDVRILDSNGSKKLVVFRTYKGNNDSIKSELLLLDSKGRIENRTFLSEIKSKGQPDFHVYGSQIFINNFSGGVLVFNENLEMVSEIERDWLHGAFSRTNMIVDEEEMLVFSSKDGTLRLTDHFFKILAAVQLNEPLSGINSLQVMNSSEVTDGMLLKTGTSDILISFSLNHRRNFIYLYWLAISCVLYAFIYLVQLIQTRQERIRVETENKLRTLQLQSIKSQMNPHFIFNALNSISAMYMQGNSVKAEKFLISFSRMIREVVDSSDRVIVTLKEEMAFVRTYLELEKVRHGENFIFNIDVPADCMEIKLPSMCIHTFVENSVKHAFPDKSKEMLIEIQATRTDKKVNVQIRDNGIGFGTSESSFGRKGRGIQMVSEIISSYSKISGKKINFIQRNIEPEENPNGGSLIEVLIEV